MKTKVCTKCKKELPATKEYFRVDKRLKCGLQPNCKECDRQYRVENKDRIAERDKKYREENKDRLTDYQIKYREDNRERKVEFNRQYREDNKEYFRSYQQKRKSFERNLPSTLTTNQWRHARSYFNHGCAYCGRKRKLEQDHFWPLSKGGGYTATNIIPACRSCNSSKHNKPFEEWYPTYESYSPEREAKIYEYFEQLALEKGEQGIQLIKQKNEVEGDR